MPRYKQIGRVSALRCRRPPASIAFCPRRRRFPLLKPARGVILARNRPESGECRLRREARSDLNFSAELCDWKLGVFLTGAGIVLGELKHEVVEGGSKVVANFSDQDRDAH